MTIPPPRPVRTSAHLSDARSYRALVRFALVLVLDGCAEPPIAHVADRQPRGTAIEQAATGRLGVERYRLRTPVDLLPPLESDEHLVESVRKNEGRVWIGLKPDDAPATRFSGEIPEMSETTVDSVLKVLEARPDVSIERAFFGSTVLVATIDADSAAAVRRLPFVNYLEPVGTLRGQVSSAAPSESPPLWTDSVPPGIVRIGAPTVWSDFGNDGSYATIAIIDTGVDSIHYGGELPISLSHCFFFNPPFSSCRDTPNGGHGTHVAGTAFAKRNSLGIVGAAPQPFRVIYFRACNSIAGNADCSSSMVLGALDWLLMNPQPRLIVTLSLGGPNTESALTTALDQLYYQQGALIVAAAGNTNVHQQVPGVLFPARLPSVIAVSGSVTSPSTGDDVLGTFSRKAETASDFGNLAPELAAPGVSYSTDSSGSFAARLGTSMAAPLVSATAALVWSQFPTWTNQQVRLRMRQTAVRRPAWNGGTFDPHFGFGRVSAVDAARPIPSIAIEIVGPSEVRPGAHCTWTATVSGAQGPLTFTWLQNGFPVGNGDEFTGTRVAGITAPYTLRVNASAGGGHQVWDEMLVNESQLAPVCFQ